MARAFLHNTHLLTSMLVILIAMGAITFFVLNASAHLGNIPKLTG